MFCVALMSRYWAGDDAWTNPPLQALARRHEESGGGLEYGSGAFDEIRYAEYDARRAAEINMKLATGNLNNNQNELVHRYASSNRRHAAAKDKGIRARDADERVVTLRQAKAQVEAELKQATAEAKSNSSGRVPGRRPSKGKKAETNTQGKVSALRRSSSHVASRSVELEQEGIQEDEYEGMQGGKEGEALQMDEETSGQSQISTTSTPHFPDRANIP
ncbi:hypothetical protein B0H13DRAFT_2300318 [Mycena leptocephala]|nr:hypothetical protein B0H13DRAFT_2300318 [Mycena leptocephala]